MYGYHQTLILFGKEYEIPYFLDVLFAVITITGIYLPMYSINYLGSSVRYVNPLTIIEKSNLTTFSSLCFGWLMIILPLLILLSTILRLPDPSRKVISYSSFVIGTFCTIITFLYLKNKFDYHYHGDVTISLREGFYFYIIGLFCTMAIPLVQREKLSTLDFVEGFKQFRERILSILGNLVPKSCPYCGEKNGRHKNFCNQCGSYLPFSDKIKCQKCERVTTGDLDYCPTCGYKFPPDTPIYEELYIDNKKDPFRFR